MIRAAARLAAALMPLMLSAAAVGAETPGREAPRADPPAVDLALVLAADTSRSMSGRNLQIQRQGYAAALRSPEVLSAIRGGSLGRIAVSFVEWSGSGWQRVVAGWTLIETGADAAALAALIERESGSTYLRTSISGALLFAARHFEANPFPAARRVIDISGDGPNNEGPPVVFARDAVIARGITINGLPLLGALAPNPIWHSGSLERYFRDCVTGGPGAFVVAVQGWEGFGEAIRKKLVLEISGLGAAGLRPAEASGPEAPADCLIGEAAAQRGSPP